MKCLNVPTSSADRSQLLRDWMSMTNLTVLHCFISLDHSRIQYLLHAAAAAPITQLKALPAIIISWSKHHTLRLSPQRIVMAGRSLRRYFEILTAMFVFDVYSVFSENYHVTDHLPG